MLNKIIDFLKPADKTEGGKEAKRHGLKRSPLWRRVEKEHLIKQPYCQACVSISSESKVQVHHIFPFHYVVALGRPDLELDDRNLITLCETTRGRIENNHHLLLGHSGDFRSSNLNVRHDAVKAFFGQSSDQIKMDSKWKEVIARRLKPLDEMSEEEKAALRKQMDDTFPLNKVIGE